MCRKYHEVNDCEHFDFYLVKVRCIRNQTNTARKLFPGRGEIYWIKRQHLKL